MPDWRRSFPCRAPNDYRVHATHIRSLNDRFGQLTTEYHEIPTVPSEVQQFLSELAHLDISSFSENLNRLLVRLDTSLSQLSIEEINAGLTNLLGAVNHLVLRPELTNSFVIHRPEQVS